MNPGTWIAIHTATQMAARNAALAAHKSSCSAEPMTQTEAWLSAILVTLTVATAVYMIAVMIRER